MRVTGDGLELLPSDVLALEARTDSARRPAVTERDELLEMAYDYFRQDRTTLVQPEVVMACVAEIVRLREENQILKVGLATRSQLVRSLTGVRTAAAGGRL